MNEPFSIRNGFREINQSEITIRNDAPHELRGVIVDLAYECGFRPKSLRTLVCRVLRKRADQGNWSEYPNIDDEVRQLIDNCEWYKVYDLIESVTEKMDETPYSYEPERFDTQLNQYFIEHGIGWQIKTGKIEFRGSEGLEASLNNARALLDKCNRLTASKELHQAILDLSRRPTPDVTGAIQHSMASLECVARDVTDNPKANLGDILKKQETLIPKPLDEAVKKAWGYASEHARHIREGREPEFEDAELMVGICASVATYLIKKEKA